MKLAMYRGKGNFYDKLIRVVTFSKYSHCELVIDGLCYSSSPRDGGVRMKYINLYDGKWDLFEVGGDSLKAKEWFIQNADKKYDWIGAITSILPITFNMKDRFFCSEACAEMLGITDSKRYKPITLLRKFT